MLFVVNYLYIKYQEKIANNCTENKERTRNVLALAGCKECLLTEYYSHFQ